MVTLGIDFASQPANTAACFVLWNGGRAEVERLQVGVNDEEVLGFCSTAEKVGIDVPFGWPTRFVMAVAAHAQLLEWPKSSIHQLRFRATDHHVRALTGKWPLSVSTDLIGIPALRAAAIFSELSRNSAPIDRAGAGRFVEVYPAASLIRWGFAKTGKKEYSALAPRFFDAVSGWLSVPAPFEAPLTNCRDAFDALIASLTARACSLGLCEGIPPEHVDSAKTEGWIALPKADTLSRLAE
jgi:predicted nuclease with RNAse H fold